MEVTPKSLSVMNISNLIDRRFTTVSILEDTRDVWHYLFDCEYIAVMDEDFSIQGIVTVKDLRNQPECRNMIDCNFEKPKVTSDHEIFEVFKVMTEGVYECLPVYDGNNFEGVITLSALAKTFADILTANKTEYETVIHDLRNPINNLYNLIKILDEPSAENKYVIELCETSCNHALNILDDLVYLAVGDSRPLTKEPTDLNAFYNGDSDECDHSIPAQADHPFRAKLTSAFRGKLTTPNA